MFTLSRSIFVLLSFYVLRLEYIIPWEFTCVWNEHTAKWIWLCGKVFAQWSARTHTRISISRFGASFGAISCAEFFDFSLLLRIVCFNFLSSFRFPVHVCKFSLSRALALVWVWVCVWYPDDSISKQELESRSFTIAECCLRIMLHKNV